MARSSDRRGPLSQQRIRLSWDEEPECIVHYRSEVWGRNGDSRVERALEFRRYPSETDFREAVYP